MKNFIKRLSAIVLTLILCFSVVACAVIEDVKRTNTAPVFNGVEEVYIEKGTTFLPLDGVTVTDAEDGNINASLIQVDARSVNVNVLGDYTVTYTVYDSDGNKTEVTRTVHVIYTDVAKPELYGVADTEIVVGEDFTIMTNVTAIDNVDGDITSKIKTTGTVDPWTIGEYEVTYKVEDTEGNVNEVTRKIKVTEGNFAFKDSKDLTFTSQKAKVTGGTIYPTIADYALLKLELTLSSETKNDVNVTVAGATGNTNPISVSTEKTYTLYFRFTAPLKDAEIAIDGSCEVVSAKYSFALSADSKAPVISNAPATICVPASATAELVKQEILRGVTAEDEIDGNVTSKLDVDLTEVNLAKNGTYKATIYVCDDQANKATADVELIVAKVRDTNIITSPDFSDSEKVAAQFKVSSGAGGSTKGEVIDGQYVFTITTPGGWASGDSPYLSGLTTDSLVAGYWYMFKMDVKAETARKMQIRAGSELWTDPWIENFKAVQVYNLTTEWQTIYYIFYVENAQSSCGSNVVKFELQLGSIDWSEGANVIYFDNAQFYLLSNKTNAPEVEEVSGKQLTFVKNGSFPDFTDYITATDVEDGNITITKDMVDLSGVDTTKAGTYKVKFNVKDSDEEVTTYEITITVLDEADTTGPVITVPQGVLTTLASYMPVNEGTDLTTMLGTVLANITITDNVDGNIVPKLDMIDFGTLKYTAANVGTHTISISCKDSFGNESNKVELTVTVKDATAPTFIGVKNYTVYVGQTFDPTKGVVAYDSNDGTIKLAVTDLGGFDSFMDATGKVTGSTGEYQVTYTVKDAAGNEATANAVITVEATEPEYNTYAKIDLLATKAEVKGGTSTYSYDTDNTLTINYAGVQGWYASYVQLKYYGVNLTADTTYKLVLTASATLPRDIMLYFVDGDANKIPGFTSQNDKHKIGLMSDSYTYEYIFTPNTASSNNSTFELEFDWESYCVNSAANNTITISELYIIPQGENKAPEGEGDKTTKLVNLDFEDGTVGDNYTNASWTQYTYKTTGWEAVNQMRSKQKVSKVVNMYSGYSMTYKYIYNENGTSLGTVTKVSFQLGNYWSPNKAFNFKVSLISTDETVTYLMGSKDEWFSVPAGETLVDYSFDVNSVEVKAIQFTMKSSENSQYAYLDNLVVEGYAPKSSYAQLLKLDFEDGAGSGNYTNAKWDQKKYESENWVAMSSAQMNSRYNPAGTSKIANIVGGWGQTRRFVYTESKNYGTVKEVQMQLGNYYSGATDIKVKVILVNATGDVTYVAGTAEAYATIPAGTDLVDYKWTCDVADVVAVGFIFYSSANANQYLYIDNIVLNGVAPEVK